VDAHLVKLDQAHPGFRDADYRARRDAIARLALAHRPGEPAPHVEYTDAEQGVWATALKALAPLHARYAATSYLKAWPKVGFTPARIPQLSETGKTISALTGFTYAPVAGLVTPLEFMGVLKGRVFTATQYMRHPSTPLYTPEPDVIHELVGHAPSLADARYAEVNQLFGEVAVRADPATIEQLIRVYWYGLEFGLAREGGDVKALGAGLLSSFGELGRFEKEAALKPFELETVARTDYDPTQYQPVLFVAESEDALLGTLRRWLEGLLRQWQRA
jgi:phenylalanine-4-hydroxylase